MSGAERDGSGMSCGVAQPGCMVWTRGTREQFRDRDDAHGHQQSVLSRSMQRRDMC